MSATRVSPATFLKRAADVASFYGFKHVRELEQTMPRGEQTFPRQRGNHSFTNSVRVCAMHAHLRPEEPILAFYATPFPTHLPQRFLARETGEFGLQVVGSSESVGEVILLKTVAAIVDEWGSPLLRVRLNALGDRESQQRFMRELSFYVRKHVDSLDPSCREGVFRGNPLSPYTCAHPLCRELRAGAPRSLNFLSEKSRTHFRTILEHLENLGLPYELDDLLWGDEREPHIVFVIDLVEGDATILGGMGGRYDDFARRISGRKQGAAVSASIFFRKKGVSRATFFGVGSSPRAPKLYFVQLGVRAKLQGLAVLDMLRRAHVPVLQSFDPNHLSLQLSAARQSGVSHLLIMGQREALDGTIIVRSMKNSSQTTYPVRELPRFLKTLRP